MKKKLFLMFSLCLALLAGALAGCGGQSAANGSAVPTAAGTAASGESSPAAGSESAKISDQAADRSAKIGIIQLVEHPALDAAREGFVAGLNDAGYTEGKNLTLNVQNAQGEQANCQTIAAQFANEDYDLILAIATPAAQAAANAITDKPILVTAVTDPAAADLVESNAAPGGNLSGTSDMNPIDKQIDLLLQLKPEAKHLTVLYTSGESNSEMQAGIAKETAEKSGLTVEIKTVASSNEIQQVVESAVASTDAIYIPTDNLIASSMGVVSQVAIAAKVPVIGGEENQLINGALATVGLNYFDLGRQTGAMADRVLKGENPGDMPIEYAKDVALAINFETAEAIGLQIPDTLKQTAKAVPAPQQ